MISVIVPVYKAEKYLHRCVDSILAQSYTDFELLLIDDGSPDKSGAICDEYVAKDSRVRVFHKENGGVSSARNLGLDNARGEWITFCDADDYVTLDWLSAYDEAITKNVDLAIQGYHIIDGDRTIKKELPQSQGYTIDDKRRLIISLMCQGVYGYLWVKLFRRQLIEQYAIRFDTNSTFREDEQFLSKYLEYVTGFKCIDRANYYYILPASEKKYGGDAYYSLFPVFQSLDVIYNHELPYEICNLHYVNIKDGAAKYITEGRRLTDYHIDLYRRMVSILEIDGMKNFMLKILILNSRVFPFFSKFVFSLIQGVL